MKCNCNCDDRVSTYSVHSNVASFFKYGDGFATPTILNEPGSYRWVNSQEKALEVLDIVNRNY